MQTDAKSGQLKNESKSARFSASYDVQEGANGTTINLFEGRLMIKLRVNLIIHLELHQKVHVKIYIKMHKKVSLRLHKKLQFRLHLGCTC